MSIFNRLILSLTLASATGVGCKELSETFEESSREMEAHRIGGPKKEPPPEPPALEEPVVDLAPKKVLKGRPLPPGSAEARLFAEVIKRIECQVAKCSQNVLTRIRKNAKEFKSAFAKLLDGQQDPRVTLEVIKIAGVLGIVEAASGVGDMALESGGEIRNEALWPLGNLGGKAAAAQLRRMLSVGVTDQNKRTICETYGRIKLPEAIPDISDLLRTPSSKVRAACALALGLTRSVKAVSHLAPLLKDKRSDVRRAAERALRAIGGAESRKALAGAGK